MSIVLSSQQQADSVTSIHKLTISFLRLLSALKIEIQTLEIQIFSLMDRRDPLKQTISVLLSCWHAGTVRPKICSHEFNFFRPYGCHQAVGVALGVATCTAGTLIGDARSCMYRGIGGRTGCAALGSRPPPAACARNAAVCSS